MLMRGNLLAPLQVPVCMQHVYVRAYACQGACSAVCSCSHTPRCRPAIGPIESSMTSVTAVGNWAGDVTPLGSSRLFVWGALLIVRFHTSHEYNIN